MFLVCRSVRRNGLEDILVAECRAIQGTGGLLARPRPGIVSNYCMLMNEPHIPQLQPLSCQTFLLDLAAAVI